MLKTYTTRDIKKLLIKNGFVAQRSRGSHEIYKRGSETVAVNYRLHQVVAQRIVKEYKLTLA